MWKYQTNKKANGQDSIDEEMWGHIFLSLKPGPERRKKKEKKLVLNIWKKIYSQKKIWFKFAFTDNI